MTKKQAKKLFGVTTDSDLARALNITPQAVQRWGGENDPIPQQRQWQIEAMKKIRKASSR